MPEKTDLKISLIICAYNEEEYIGKCLDYAIKNSNGKFDEIIVVDNASTDKTTEVASSYEGVRVVREERKGQVRARQRGYMESRGDILVFFDADTEMPPGWISKALSRLDKNERTICVSGPCLYYDISKFHRFLVKIIYWYALAMPTYWMVGYMIQGAHFAIRRSALEKINGFDTTIEFYGEDTNIARRASKIGRVVFMPTLIMYVSGRRLNSQGVFKTAFIYIRNFLSEVFYHKPATKAYKDFR